MEGVSPVFDRHNIVSGTDLRELPKQVEQHNREIMVTDSVTVIPLKNFKNPVNN